MLTRSQVAINVASNSLVTRPLTVTPATGTFTGVLHVMRLIRLTLIVHLLLHAALWALAISQMTPATTSSDWAPNLYQVLCGALIIHLGSYHWAMAQWQEDLCEGVSWPTVLMTALLTLVLGVVVLLSSEWALYAAALAAALLFWQETWGQITRYIQPWYLRLRWLQLASLLLTQVLVA